MTEPWTEEALGDQSGRLVVITGANSGIGWEAARALAAHGARVVLACRSEARGADAVDRIRALHPEARVELERLDLGDLASVRAFAERLPHDRIDLLINNAGVMAIPRQLTADGFEMQFGVNHLGHFALTGLLLDRLADGARVVHVSSNGHKGGRMRFDDLMGERSYERWTQYCMTKLANLLFSLELQRRFEAEGRGRLSVGCHPGYAATNLMYRGPEHDGRPWMRSLFAAANALFAQGPRPGAAPTLRAATDPAARPNDYFGPRGLGQLRGPPVRVAPAPKALDAEAAVRLWAESVRLTGVDYLTAAPAARQDPSGVAWMGPTPPAGRRS